MSVHQSILDIAEIFAQHHVIDLVMSPGSRNAPLTLSLSRHPGIETYVVSDERSAGYIALGMSQSTSNPVLLLSTSGTAALNYGPAIAEAYFQQVPLIVITADRPPEWIDQNDGQAIRQKDAFSNHVKKGFQIPTDLSHKDAQWHAHRIINEAIFTSLDGVPGPVHINVPFREPFYPSTEQHWHYNPQPQVVSMHQGSVSLKEEDWDELVHQWEASQRIIVVGGQAPVDLKLIKELDHFQSFTSVPVIGDAISNLHTLKNVIRHPEIILAQSPEKLGTLQPDLVVSFGNSVISKNLKLFLRNFAPKHHWHLQPSGFPADTFKALTKVVPLTPSDFITGIQKRVSRGNDQKWFLDWQKEEKRACSILKEFLDDQEFNELGVVRTVLNSADNFHLHLANSTPVRWADWTGISPNINEVFANRGASGIDGCSSTAVGHALKNNGRHLLVTGDMAFLYDRNAFWHQHKVERLKIVVLNNHGGGIFRLIDGPRNQPEIDDLFVTQQALTAERTAKDYGMSYITCDKNDNVKEKLEALLGSEEIALLEINVPNNMETIYQELKEKIKQ